MYEHGEGVERNYETAVAWREKKIAIIEKAYRENPNDVYLNTLFWTIFYCGNAYEKLGKLAAAREKYEQGQRLIEESGRQEKEKIILRNLSVGYSKLGSICPACGDLDGAMTYFEKAFAIHETLVNKTDTPENYDHLADSYFKIAMISEVRQKKKLLKKAVRIYQKLCRAYPDVEQYHEKRMIIRSALKSRV